jgi:hypothetical protein
MRLFAVRGFRLIDNLKLFYIVLYYPKKISLVLYKNNISALPKLRVNTNYFQSLILHSKTKI